MKPIRIVLSLVAVMSSVSASASRSTTESVTTTKTYLRFLDQPILTCDQGLKDNGQNYPTPSGLNISGVALDLPTQNAELYHTFSKELGYPCEDFKRDFMKYANEHGTIPVIVTRKLRKSYHTEAWVQTNEKGENVHATYHCQEKLNEVVTFSVGEFSFSGYSEFDTVHVPMDKCMHH